MKKSSLNIPVPTRSSRKNAKPPVLTGNTGPKNPGEPPASRPDHATRFRKGVSGNPQGRPIGSLNKSTLEARAVLAANARKLTARAIQLALKGSPTAMRLCLERILPAMQDRPVQLNLPTRKTTAQDLLAAHNVLLASVADGTLTPLEAEAVSKLLEARRRSWESVEMEDRIIQLQDDAQAAKKIGPPPANIKWVGNDQMPSPKMPSQAEQDRLDAQALEEDDALAEEAMDLADEAMDEDEEEESEEDADADDYDGEPGKDEDGKRQ